MCQQNLVQFCAGSTKPLVYVGSCILLLLGFTLTVVETITNLFYTELDPLIASQRSIGHYLQIGSAVYLTVVAILASFAAYHDQKQHIRALSIITSANFILAVLAILMSPGSNEVGKLLVTKLGESQSAYNYTDPPPTAPANMSKQITPQDRVTRSTDSSEAQKNYTLTQKMIVTPEEATRLWDGVQALGCCGLHNATQEWSQRFPKSCCKEAAKNAQSNFTCNDIDEEHKQPCGELIEQKEKANCSHLMILLTLIAIANLYLAIVTGISTYRTFHYNEASQNAYS